MFGIEMAEYIAGLASLWGMRILWKRSLLWSVSSKISLENGILLAIPFGTFY